MSLLKKSINLFHNKIKQYFTRQMLNLSVNVPKKCVCSASKSLISELAIQTKKGSKFGWLEWPCKPSAGRFPNYTDKKKTNNCFIVGTYFFLGVWKLNNVPFVQCLLLFMSQLKIGTSEKFGTEPTSIDGSFSPLSHSLSLSLPSSFLCFLTIFLYPAGTYMTVGCEEGRSWGSSPECTAGRIG